MSRLTRRVTRTAVRATAGSVRMTATLTVKAAHDTRKGHAPGEPSALTGIMIIVFISVVISLIQIAH